MRTNDKGKLPADAHDVEALFDDLAPHYDFLDHVFSLGLDYTWRWRATNKLRPAIPGPLLDGATGSGDFALAVARKYSDHEIVGLDFSAGMLAQAKRKMKKREEGRRIDWQQGDLTAMPFADETFAAATVAFGLRNVTDRPAALSEFYRVLKPGGRLVNLDFAMPTMPVFAPVYKWYFRNIMPVLADLFGVGRAYRYLYQSVGDFPPTDAFCQTIAEAGFASVVATPMTFGTVMLYVAEKA